MQCLNMLIVSLNVLNDPRIAPDSPHHFFQRWPRIRQVIGRADVVALQEVHETFLGTIEEYADESGMRMTSALYHTVRSTHLVTLVPKDWYQGHDVSYYPDTYTATLSVSVGGHRVTNVHLPLDARDAGERRAATRAVVGRNGGPSSIVIGDWNTLPGLGDDNQLSSATEQGMRMVDWKIVGEVEATAYGFPHEAPCFQKFTNPAILDRAAVGNDVNLVLAECRHDFGPDGWPVSDHFPCWLEVSAK